VSGACASPGRAAVLPSRPAEERPRRCAGAPRSSPASRFDQNSVNAPGPSLGQFRSRTRVEPERPSIKKTTFPGPPTRTSRCGNSNGRASRVTASGLRSSSSIRSHGAFLPCVYPTAPVAPAQKRGRPAGRESPFPSGSKQPSAVVQVADPCRRTPSPAGVRRFSHSSRSDRDGGATPRRPADLPPPPKNPAPGGGHRSTKTRVPRSSPITLPVPVGLRDPRLGRRWPLRRRYEARPRAKETNKAIFPGDEFLPARGTPAFTCRSAFGATDTGRRVSSLPKGIVWSSCGPDRRRPVTPLIFRVSRSPAIERDEVCPDRSSWPYLGVPPPPTSRRRVLPGGSGAAEEFEARSAALLRGCTTEARLGSSFYC